MNKPLKDWTLGEIKVECKKNKDTCMHEKSCPFITTGKSSGTPFCRIVAASKAGLLPVNWDLSEPPRWTDDEIKFAEIFKLACKNEIFFERLKGSQILLWGEVGIDPTADAVLPYKLLPSLKEGERATLDEIIGGAE